MYFVENSIPAEESVTLSGTALFNTGDSINLEFGMDYDAGITANGVGIGITSKSDQNIFTSSELLFGALELDYDNDINSITSMSIDYISDHGKQVFRSK